MKPIHCAYLVVAAGVCSALHIAKVSPALAALRLEFGLSVLQAGVLISIVQFAGMLLGLVIGALVEVWGLRNSMVLGLGIMAVCSFAGIYADSATLLLVLRALEGVCFLLVIMPAPALIRQLTTPIQLSKMLGVWGAYMPIGTAVSLLLGTIVIVWMDWRKWWLLLALVTFLAAAAVYSFLPKNINQSSPKPALSDIFSNLYERVRLTLKSPGPWLIAIGFTMYSGQWLAIVGFLPSIYESAGISEGLAGLMTSLVAAANIIGNVYAGRLLARHIPPPYLLYVGFVTMFICAIVAFATLGLPYAWLNWVRFGFILLLSAIGGLIPGTMFCLAVQLAPSQNTISTTVGWVQQLSSTGQFFLPPLVGALADANQGSWQWTWVILCTCSMVGLCIAKLCAIRFKKGTL